MVVMTLQELFEGFDIDNILVEAEDAVDDPEETSGADPESGGPETPEEDADAAAVDDPEETSGEDPAADDAVQDTNADGAIDEKDAVNEERKLAENPELESLKKFLLIQKLQELNTNLISRNILNNSLSTFLDFSGSLSYDTILSVSAGFTDYIIQNLKNLNKESGEKTA